MINRALAAAEKRLPGHERFHHPHPRVRQKMEVQWLQSQGLAPREILRAAGITTKTMRRCFGHIGKAEWNGSWKYVFIAHKAN